MNLKQYRIELEKSVGSLLGRVLFSGKELVDENKYDVAFDDGIHHFELSVYGKDIKHYVKPVHELVQERLDETGEIFISPAEMLIMQYDGSVCLNFMTDSLFREEYDKTRDYAKRFLDNCVMLRSHYKDSNSNVLDAHIEYAERMIKKADILEKYPETGFLRLQLEDYVLNEEYEEAAELKGWIADLER